METEGEESETPPVESDSEGVMIAPKPSKRKQKPEAKPVSSIVMIGCEVACTQCYSTILDIFILGVCNITMNIDIIRYNK